MDRNIVILILGVSAAALGVGYLFFARKEVEEENRGLIDDWGNQMLAVELARKLGLEKAEVLFAIENEHDSEINEKIQNLVDDIKIKFNKLSASEIVAEITLKYLDENNYSAKRTFSWLDIPEAIRKEFLRTNKKTVILEWHFPWSQA